MSTETVRHQDAAGHISVLNAWHFANLTNIVIIVHITILDQMISEMKVHFSYVAHLLVPLLMLLLCS